jgi:hypothetical protein
VTPLTPIAGGGREQRALIVGFAACCDLLKFAAHHFPALAVTAVDCRSTIGQLRQLGSHLAEDFGLPTEKCIGLAPTDHNEVQLRDILRN